MKIVSFHRGTPASSVFFALFVMLMTTRNSSSSSTTSFAAAVAATTNNSNGDDIVDGDTTTTTTSDSSRIHDTSILLHLRGVGGQDEKVTTTITTTGACTTSCKNGKTCTPGSDFCTRMYSLVCGCNGREYTNTCEAFKAGVNVRHVGACGSSEEDDEDIDVMEEEGVVSVVSS